MEEKKNTSGIEGGGSNGSNDYDSCLVVPNLFKKSFQKLKLKISKKNKIKNCSQENWVRKRKEKGKEKDKE